MKQPSRATNDTDQLDPQRAAAYAWKVLRPGEALEEPPAGEGEPPGATGPAPDATGPVPDATDPALRELREQAHRDCAAIAAAVDRAWVLAAPAQPEAVTTLLFQAAKLGIALVAMHSFPLQSVRLLRLAARCSGELGDEARAAAQTVAMWTDLEHAEMVDLLVEVAVSGDEDLGGAFAFALAPRPRGETVGRMPEANERFARVLDDGPSWEARLMAVNWLSLAPRKSAAPALRRALRQPHFVLRYRALELLNRKLPDAIQPDDVMFLLEDAVSRVPPERTGNQQAAEASLFMPDLLASAVERLRPAGGAEPLLHLALGQCAQTFDRLSGCTMGWALAVLAKVYPDRAVPIIDELMQHVEFDRRIRAVDAAARLPDELAWPRLRGLAADGMPEIAERAQEAWLERRGETCPVGELACIDTSLLDAAPDERTLSRIALLRRAPLEARAAMVEVLLGEAPDPAALALLLFALVDDYLWLTPPRPSLPRRRAVWCARLVTLFGARAVIGICAMEMRYPRGRYGWLSSLSEVAEKQALPEEAHDVARRTAARRLVETGEGERLVDLVRHSALAILAKVGMPAELFAHVSAIADDAQTKDYVRDVATAALATMAADDPRTQAIVKGTLAAALAEGDFERANGCLLFGLRAGFPEAFAAAERVLAEQGPAPVGAALDAVATCARELRKAGRLPEGWDRGALGRPGSNGFCVVARRARAKGECPDWDPELTEPLRAGLSCGDPTTEAETAVTLVRERLLAADDPEVERILDRAPLALRAKLVCNVHYLCGDQEGLERRLWRWFEPCLVSPDRRVTGSLYRSAVRTLARSDVKAELRALLPRVENREVQSWIEDEFHRADEDDDGEDDDWQDEDGQEEGDTGSEEEGEDEDGEGEEGEDEHGKGEGEEGEEGEDEHGKGEGEEGEDEHGKGEGEEGEGEEGEGEHGKGEEDEDGEEGSA